MQLIFFYLLCFPWTHSTNSIFRLLSLLIYCSLIHFPLSLWFIYCFTLLTRHLFLPFVKVSLLYIIFLFWYNLTRLSFRDFSYILFCSKRFLIYAEFPPSFTFLYVFFSFFLWNFTLNKSWVPKGRGLQLEW